MPGRPRSAAGRPAATQAAPRRSDRATGRKGRTDRRQSRRECDDSQVADSAGELTAQGSIQPDCCSRRESHRDRRPCVSGAMASVVLLRGRSRSGRVATAAPVLAVGIFGAVQISMADIACPTMARMVPRMAAQVTIEIVKTGNSITLTLPPGMIPQRRRRAHSDKSAINIGSSSRRITMSTALTLDESSAIDSAAAPARWFAASALAVAVAACLLAGWFPLGVSIVVVFLFAGPHNWMKAAAHAQPHAGPLGTAGAVLYHRHRRRADADGHVRRVAGRCPTP